MKVKPELNDEVEPAIEEPKSEGEEPKADVVPEKREGEELEPNPGLLGANSEGVDEVEPKGLDDGAPNEELKREVDDEPKPVEPKAGVLGAKGLDDEAAEKGFAAGWPNVPVGPNVPVEPNGFAGV